MPPPAKSYRDLLVWQKAMTLATETYRVANLLPQSELFGLSDQLRRAAVSIPSNIAEGRARDSQKEFAKFISIAKGSNAELETQLELCNRLGYLSPSQTEPATTLANEVGRMLTTLSSRIKTQLSAPPMTNSNLVEPNHFTC